MEVKVIKSGLLQTNTYVVSKENNCIIIDPAFGYDEIVSYINSKGYRVLAILLTHGHFDHIGACNDLARLYNCRVYIGKDDVEIVVNPDLNGARRYAKKDIIVEKQFLKAFDHEIILKLDNFMIDVLFTPGHSKGGCCYLIDNELFSGDTLFKNDVGRVDLYGGDKKEMQNSLKYLLTLNGDVVVFPGHGNETTIERERNRYI